MEEQFVTHEIAKKLKGMDFREKCMGYYQLKEEFQGCTDAEYEYFNSEHFKLKINYPYRNSDGYFNDDDISNLSDCVAPLWQQCLDWLRISRHLFVDWSLVDVFDINKGYKVNISHSKYEGGKYCSSTGYFAGQVTDLEKIREEAILNAISIIEN